MDQAQRPDARQESAKVAAPYSTRPESDQWFCSLRLGVLEGDVKSRALKKAFGWDRPVPGLVLAVQLLALSKKFEVRRFFLVGWLRNFAPGVLKCTYCILCICLLSWYSG